MSDPLGGGEGIFSWKGPFLLKRFENCLWRSRNRRKSLEGLFSKLLFSILLHFSLKYHVYRLRGAKHDQAMGIKPTLTLQWEYMVLSTHCHKKV